MRYRFTALVKRWRDVENGNSYYSVRLTDNTTGKVLAFSMVYGEDWKRMVTLDQPIDEDSILWIVVKGTKADMIENGQLPPRS